MSHVAVHPFRNVHGKPLSDGWLVATVVVTVLLLLVMLSVWVPLLRLPVAIMVAPWIAGLLLGSSEATVLAVLGWGLIRGLPFLPSDAAVSLLGRSISTIGAALIVLLLFVAVRCVVVAARHHGSRRGRAWMPFALPLLAAVSLFWTGALSQGARWVGYLTITAGVYYLVAYDIAPHARRQRRFILCVLAALTLFCAGSLAYGRVLDTSEDVRFQDARGARLKGLADSPNVLAGTVVTLGAIALGITLTKRIRSRWYWAGAVTFAAIVPVVVMSGSRSGLAGLGIAITVGLLATKRWRLVSVVLLAGIVAVAVGERPASVGSWRDLVQNPFDEALDKWQTATTRFIIWRDAAAALVRPRSAFFGRGAGMTDQWCESDPSCSDAGGLHSEVLRTFIDLGLAGGLIILAIFVYFMVAGWKISRDGHVVPLERALALAGLCAVTAAVPRVLWDLLFNAQIAWFLMIVVGLMPLRSWQGKKKRAGEKRVA